MRLFLEKIIQTSSPSLSSKVVKLGFWSQKMCNDLKRMKKKHFPIFFFRLAIFSFQVSATYISTKNLVLLRFLSKSDLHTFQKILRKWNKLVQIFSFRNFFFLKSSETYAKIVIKIGIKILFSSGCDYIFLAYVSNDTKKKNKL